MIEHRCTTATVRMVLKTVESKGVDANELLNLAGIDRETAENLDGEISFCQMRAFWQNAFQLSGDPLLGMHTAQQVEIGDYKYLDYLMIHAATVGASIQNICRYTALINTWIHWEIQERNDDIAICMSSNIGTIWPHAYEFVFSFMTKRIRQITTESWTPKRICLPFSSPINSQAHKDFFRTTLQYDAPVGILVICRDSWNQPLPTSDQQLMSVLDEHARMLLEKRPLPDDFVGQVRKQIVRELHGGEALRKNVAEKLNMSPRTLQRRLDKQGVMYADLVDEVRAELAKTKLQASDLSLPEIGSLLGFSEQSSFNRAFKRWTGKTPREYRRKMLL
ncbi:MAG: AraC family transcriptional regulator [Gammaproteobacteria bacterium]|nr:AraC family transcriptional regulator [Gammaproteobacteria bacterium]